MYILGVWLVKLSQTTMSTKISFGIIYIYTSIPSFKFRDTGLNILVYFTTKARMEAGHTSNTAILEGETKTWPSKQ